MWLQSPSCGSVVKAGNKESMCVDSSVQTSCATDINANNVHNDSMDFDHDPKAWNRVWISIQLLGVDNTAGMALSGSPVFF
nr:hypothetical protein [Tanacetum cinerariifolium]